MIKVSWLNKVKFYREPKEIISIRRKHPNETDIFWLTSDIRTDIDKGIDNNKTPIIIWKN